MTRRWLVTLKREGKPTLRLFLPTLNQALEVSRTDASWYGASAIITLNPVQEAKG
jgi:hypothetical protein